jgi:type I phosphodiesterase/nucleotide pyrophosphatase
LDSRIELAENAANSQDGEIGPMSPFRKILMTTAVATGVLGGPLAAGAVDVTAPGPAEPVPYAHVLLISIDGMHSIDLTNFLNNPANIASTLKTLSKHAVIYPNAYTSAPSDSFPGIIAQVTGGTPKSTGVFYDDSYDRTLFAPGSNCVGPAGTETAFAENIDVDKNKLNAGGKLGQPLTQIDPAKLPMAKVSGKCEPFYPHQFIRVNTLFEVVKAHGGHTAWSDKHAGYEILNGPSGKGIDDLFTPEINSLFPGSGTTDRTGSFTATQRYDEVKVRAILHEIAGLDSTGRKPAPVPAIFGMNFQSVSVGQKLAQSGPTDPPGLVGGYADGNATPNNALAGALTFVDDALGQMVTALAAHHLLDSTLIIISAKHGQSPIDRALRVAIDDGPYSLTPGHAFHIADDAALIWLAPQTRATDLEAAQKYLTQPAQTQGLRIAQLLTPASLKDIYQDPATDSRTPDFIALSTHGVIYTTGTKLSEHGGFSNDDRNVALMVASPRLSHRIIETFVQTTQIAPTILKKLDLNPNELQAVKLEGTKVLPDLGK